MAGCEHTMDAAVRMQEAIMEGNWPIPSDILLWIKEPIPPLPPGHRMPSLVRRGDILRALFYLGFLMVAQLVFPGEDFATLLLIALGWWIVFVLVTVTAYGWMIRLGADMHCHCDCKSEE